MAKAGIAARSPHDGRAKCAQIRKTSGLGGFPQSRSWDRDVRARRPCRSLPEGRAEAEG